MWIFDEQFDELMRELEIRREKTPQRFPDFCNPYNGSGVFFTTFLYFVI